MFTVRRRAATRLAAAALASGLVAVGAITGAGTAFADQTPQAGGAAGTLGGLVAKGTAHVQGEGQVEAGLFDMTIDGGGDLTTYCIDIHHPTSPGETYQESPWSGTSLATNPDAGKIRWILQNSYPQVDDLSKLASEAGVPHLTKDEAAAGTQVAIWRYSDHVKVTADDANAEKLSEWLSQQKQDLAEPSASLTVSPPSVSGKAGTEIGPVTVHTNATSAQLSLGAGAPAGVKLVDKSGHAITDAANGTQVYFDVPAGTAPGSAGLSVQATTTVPIGRAFIGVGRSVGKQTQILAGSSASTVAAQATASWAKQGAIPAVSAMVDCAKSGVDVTATDQGDDAFTFSLAGKTYTIQPGKSQTITVPVKEGQAYSITISGPNGFKKTFSGVLDCKNTGGGSTPSPVPSSSTTSSTTGGSTGGSSGGLAETGSSSATPIIGGMAVVLVVVGGGTVFFLRKRKGGGAA
ncbi:Cys-Gln thioester bond-forming surface protein [Streptomyces sp. PTM05]|uniref:Cys-Gln thioester bond-forming surface protein n=1 Tax=Streptantibioticus parmotrematis TaxID=2873249 RepID=A0ABS7QTI8_9ACTN|nr:Cys-Gln thioester bond-forming surface protein [Streptantibioticus parmotrematis]MBY8886505.1 Cys-Gln thioester bond-forming surface protein [Streptantibioticus parmotrematis]